MLIKDRVAIVGIGQTTFAKAIDESELSLACRAIQAALSDAGLVPTDVDGLCSYTKEAGREVEVARNLGFESITFYSQVGYGGGGGCATIAHAAMAIATDQARVVVAWRARKRGSKASRPWANKPARVGGHEMWSRPWGLSRPVDEMAMLARRAMHDRGLTRDHLANVALAARLHANRNPAAMMYQRPLTRADYMSARWVSEPLCLFDNCLESDGAVAVVLVAADRALDLQHPAVYVHAAAQGFEPGHQPMTNFHSSDPLRGPSNACSSILWRHADFGPGDVAVAQIYDSFTPLVPASLEGYGFCNPGEGGSFTEGGNLEWPSGGLPLNTSGGSLSEAYIHGFNLISEGVRQMRGTSTSQVMGATTCFISSGDCVPTSALLLRA